MISLFTKWQKINFNFSKIYSSSLKGNNLFVRASSSTKLTSSNYPHQRKCQCSNDRVSESEHSLHTIRLTSVLASDMSNLRVPQLREQILNPCSEPKKALHSLHCDKLIRATSGLLKASFISNAEVEKFVAFPSRDN